MGKRVTRNSKRSGTLVVRNKKTGRAEGRMVFKGAKGGFYYVKNGKRIYVTEKMKRKRGRHYSG